MQRTLTLNHGTPETRTRDRRPCRWTALSAAPDACGRLLEDISRPQRAIRRGEGEEIERLIEASREIRRSLIDARQA